MTSRILTGNSTNRKRITSRHFKIICHDPRGLRQFTIEKDFDLWEELDLPSDAHVKLEVSAKGNAEFLHFGTVEQFLNTSSDSNTIQEIAITHLPFAKFYLSVVSVLEEEKGKVLAASRKARAYKTFSTIEKEEEEKEKVPATRHQLLIELQSKDDLKEVWMLNFEHEGEPVMFINTDSWDDLSQNAEFEKFIAPEIVRQVLGEILKEKHEYNFLNHETPWSLWGDLIKDNVDRRIVNRCPKKPSADGDHSNYATWINEVVSELAFKWGVSSFSWERD